MPALNVLLPIRTRHPEVPILSTVNFLFESLNNVAYADEGAHLQITEVLS